MKLLKIYLKVKTFLAKYKEDHISAFSSQAAFFTFLSFVPFILFLFTMIQYLPISQEMVSSAILRFVPKETSSLVQSVLSSIYSNVSETLLPFSIITALWSASKGVLAISNGLNVIVGIKETRNYLLLRIVSMFYTFIFSILIILLLILLVFGNSLYRYMIKMVPVLETILNPILDFRFFGAGIVLILFFSATYYFIPNCKQRYWNQFPGAIFATLGWTGLSLAFSIYIDHSKNFSYMYGSLTSIIILMLWLYACMTIFFIGAEINYFLQHLSS